MNLKKLFKKLKNKFGSKDVDELIQKLQQDKQKLEQENVVLEHKITNVQQRQQQLLDTLNDLNQVSYSFEQSSSNEPLVLKDILFRQREIKINEINDLVSQMVTNEKKLYAYELMRDKLMEFRNQGKLSESDVTSLLELEKQINELRETLKVINNQIRKPEEELRNIDEQIEKKDTDVKEIVENLKSNIKDQTKLLADTFNKLKQNDEKIIDITQDLIKIKERSQQTTTNATGGSYVSFVTDVSEEQVENKKMSNIDILYDAFFEIIDCSLESDVIKYPKKCAENNQALQAFIKTNNLTFNEPLKLTLKNENETQLMYEKIKTGIEETRFLINLISAFLKNENLQVILNPQLIEFDQNNETDKIEKFLSNSTTIPYNIKIINPNEANIPLLTVEQVSLGEKLLNGLVNSYKIKSRVYSFFRRPNEKRTVLKVLEDFMESTFAKLGKLLEGEKVVYADLLFYQLTKQLEITQNFMRTFEPYLTKINEQFMKFFPLLDEKIPENESSRVNGERELQTINKEDILHVITTDKRKVKVTTGTGKNSKQKFYSIDSNYSVSDALYLGTLIKMDKVFADRKNLHTIVTYLIFLEQQQISNEEKQEKLVSFLKNSDSELNQTGINFLSLIYVFDSTGLYSTADLAMHKFRDRYSQSSKYIILIAAYLYYLMLKWSKTGLIVPIDDENINKNKKLLQIFYNFNLELMENNELKSIVRTPISKFAPFSKLQKYTDFYNFLTYKGDSRLSLENPINPENTPSALEEALEEARTGIKKVKAVTTTNEQPMRRPAMVLNLRSVVEFGRSRNSRAVYAAKNNFGDFLRDYKKLHSSREDSYILNKYLKAIRFVRS